MSQDLAVVMDVAGTILRMYRVAKDIERGIILERVVTWELIMEKKGRALVVPQMDPDIISSFRPEDPLCSLIAGREELLDISCSSSSISRDEALSIVLQSKALVRDIMDVHIRVKERCPENYRTAGMIVDANIQEIVYAISTGGSPFPGMKDVLRTLEKMGADVFVASGDSMRSLSHLRELGVDLSHISAVSTPARKKEIVEDLKREYKHVVMVGDGLNDIYALRAADLGVLTVQQDTRPAKILLAASDEIISDIRELPELLKRNSRIIF